MQWLARARALLGIAFGVAPRDGTLPFDGVQEQWLEFREADCRWESSLYDGGFVRPAIYEGCMSRLAARRIERLKLFLCEGWGMTGPCEASERYDEPE